MVPGEASRPDFEGVAPYKTGLRGPSVRAGKWIKFTVFATSDPSALLTCGL